MNKRILTLLLVAVMSLALLGACGGGQDAPAGGETGGADGASQGSGVQNSEPQGGEAGGAVSDDPAAGPSDEGQGSGQGGAAASPTPDADPTPIPDKGEPPTAQPTPEATPEVTPEATPEATPEVTPEATPEVTPEPTPEAAPEPPEPTPETQNGVVQAVWADISALELPASMDLDAALLADIYGLDSANLVEYACKMPMMMVHATEFFIAQVKEGSMDTVKAAVEARQAALLAQWSSYLPDQLELVENYKLIINGDYILFAVTEHADAVEDIFNSYTK